MDWYWTAGWAFLGGAVVWLFKVLDTDPEAVVIVDKVVSFVCAIAFFPLFASYGTLQYVRATLPSALLAQGVTLEKEQWLASFEPLAWAEKALTFILVMGAGLLVIALFAGWLARRKIERDMASKAGV